jgi:acetolactate decarboxylase
MLDDELKTPRVSPRPASWCVEWFGSQGDFIAGKTKDPVPLERFAGLESLYAVGPLEQGGGEVSIFDSVTLISQVNNSEVKVTIGQEYRAGFLVYAIVEKWRRATVRMPIENERRFEEQLLPLAVESGIDIDRPFPYLIHCHVAQAMFHVLCNLSPGEYSPQLHEKAKVRFEIIEEAVEIVGFYSRRHRGIFTPPHSDFHMHVRMLDNCASGHLETFTCDQGMTVYLPASR